MLFRSPLADVSDDEISQIFRTNVMGPMSLCREAFPFLKKSQGSIINISTTMTKGVVPGSAVYSSSKAALDHMTRILAAEFGPSGVRVNAVAPGLTVTDMTKEARNDDEMMNMIISQTPMGRIGEPAEIASAVLMMSSMKAAWVTGQILQAGGGIML